MKRLIVLFAALFAFNAAAVDRSTTERDRFARANPCPADGKKYYAKCAGWQIDHVVPISAGGGDVSGNLQWLPVEAKKAKDRIERASASCLRGKHKEACPVIDWKRAKP